MSIEDKYERFLQKLKTVKFYYDFVLREGNNMKKIEFKWRKETKVNMKVEDLFEGFQDLYVVTNQARLLSFQYRILHKAIILNDRMFKWGKLDNDLCTNCKSKKETLYHFFWECEIFQKVIGWVHKMCEDIDSQQNIELSYRNVIFNKIVKQSGHIFNFIMLVAKQYVYAQRCLKNEVSKEQLRTRIESYRRYELNYAISQNMLKNTVTNGVLIIKKTKSNTMVLV